MGSESGPIPSSETEEGIKMSVGVDGCLGQLTIVTRQDLQDLMRKVDGTVELDDDVEDLLINYTESFIEDIFEGTCQLSKHRRSTTVERKDFEAYLQKKSNNKIEGARRRPYKRAPPPPVTEAHKQRVALIKKSLKKY